MVLSIGGTILLSTLGSLSVFGVKITYRHLRKIFLYHIFVHNCYLGKSDEKSQTTTN